MSESPNDSMSPALLLGIALVLIVTWGTAYTFVSIAVRDVEPIWLVASRTALASTLLAAYVKIRGRKFPPLNDVRWLWYGGLGIIGIVLPFYLFAVAQQTVDSGVCAIIASSMPLFTIILAHFFAGESLSWRKFIGFVIGFAGVIILFLPDNFSLDLISDWRAQLLALAASFSYAVTTVTAKRAPDTPASVGAAMMVIGGAVIAMALALTSGLPSALPSALGIGSIIALGIGSTGFATILYLNVVQKAGPSALARINYFPAIVSVAAGVWVLGEEFSWRIVIAFSVTFIGVVISRWEKKKPLPVTAI